MALTALALNCTLKRGGATSSTDKLLKEVLQELKPLGVTGDIVKVVDLDIKAGVSSDEGDGDDWPELRRKILGADIVILGTDLAGSTLQRGQACPRTHGRLSRGDGRQGAHACLREGCRRGRGRQ